MGYSPDSNIAEYVDRYRWLLLSDTHKVRRDGPTPIRMTQDLRDLTDQLILADGTNEVIESLQMILGSKATRERFTEWLGADLCRALDVGTCVLCTELYRRCGTAAYSATCAGFNFDMQRNWLYYKINLLSNIKEINYNNK